MASTSTSAQIVPPPDVDVTMIAPKSPGHRVRELFQEGVGVPALIAIEQDATGHASERALAYAKGIGSHAAPACSRRPSRKRPKPISSASRLCFAAAFRR